MEIVMTEMLEEMSAFFNHITEKYNEVHLEHIDSGMESNK
jgi:hypothetical protein